jgi:hypothetical protein
VYHDDHHHPTELQLLGDIHNPDESPKKNKKPAAKKHLKNTWKTLINNPLPSQ